MTVKSGGWRPSTIASTSVGDKNPSGNSRRTEQRNTALATQNEHDLRELHDQERAARELARAGWAPALDRQWLAQAGLVDVARTWSAAAAYADADPGAATALARCEARMRHLHPYAMSWYDRLRAEGAGTFDAMRDALPLFARAPHARPGGPGRPRSALPPGAQAATASTSQSGQPQEEGVSITPAPSAGDDVGSLEARDAVSLAAQSFPWTATDAVLASSSASAQAAARQRVVTAQPAARPRPMS